MMLFCNVLPFKFYQKKHERSEKLWISSTYVVMVAGKS